MLLLARWCLSIIARNDFIFRVYSEIWHIACFEGIDDQVFVIIAKMIDFVLY